MRKIDGFDEACIGYAEVGPSKYRFVYDRQKMISVLCERDGMDSGDADEYISFNIDCAWVEDKPLILCPCTSDSLDEEADLLES
jgi:hypothetical protein